MILKKLGVAMLAALALSAVVAGTSQAAMWNSSGIGTWASGTSSFASATTFTTNVLTSKVLGSPFKLTSNGLQIIEGKITQSGASALVTGRLVFSGTKVDEPAGCKTFSFLETEPLTITAQMGNSVVTTHSVYLKIQPSSGEVLATIKLAECAAAGNYQLKGVLYVKATWPTGTAVVVQNTSSSGEINASQGGALTVGKEPATLNGELAFELSSGETLSLLE